MATARFPWDLVKAESLRTICRDLGGPAGRRDEMVTFLQTTEEQGIDDALELVAKATPEQKASKPAVTPSTPTLKRDRQPVVSDYNTRHRDKRVRISDPGPGRKAGRKNNTSSPSQATVRSPKSRSKAARQPETSSKGRRTIFDGVVLRRFFSSADKGKDKTDAVVSNGVTPEQKGDEERGEEEDEHMEDEHTEAEQMEAEQTEAEQMGDEQMGAEQMGDEQATDEQKGDEQQGDEEGDANESLAPEEVAHVLEGLDDSRVESSLASSNKENEGITPDQVSGVDEPIPGDAASSHSAQRVLEHTVEVAAQMTDEDMDAEGEIEHEQETAVRHEAPVPSLPEVPSLSPDVNHIKETVDSAMENGQTV